MATKTGSVTAYPSEFVSDDYSYASVNSSYPATNPIGKSSSNTSYAQFNLKTGSSAETWVYYRFDLSEIPRNATITSISCSAKAYVNQTNSNRINTRQVQMFSGTTAKGSASTISTSTTALNLSVGSWTREELDDCRIRIYVKRGTSSTTSIYYTRFYGATLTVNYSYEDVQYTITTNVTGGTIDPSNPSVSQGDSQIFKISGANGVEELTSLTLDGNNVLSQAVRKENSGSLDYTVSSAGASYSFSQSGNYYVSGNKGVSSSCALCKVDFDFPVECTVDFYVINYAEATYDYGLLSNIDTTLSSSASADTSNVYWNGKNNNSASEQKVTYTIPSGEHFVTVKFFKDGNTNSNNDTLQFRIEITPNETISSGTFYYEYTLSNVTSAHTLNATFGAVTMYTVDITCNNGTVTPSGSNQIISGSSIKISSKPNYNYQFSSMTVNGTSVTPTEKTIAGIENGVCLFHLDGNSVDELGTSTLSSVSYETSQKKFGNASIYLDGNSYFTLNLPEDYSPVTVECWFNITQANASGKYPTLFSTTATASAGGTYMHIDDGAYNTKCCCRSNAKGSSSNTGGYGTTVVSRNEWHHFAYCRNGNSHYFFIDGVLQYTVSQSNPYSMDTIYFGGLRGNGQMQSGCYMTGYIDEIMVSSVCKWTSAFTPTTIQYNSESTTEYEYTLSNITENKNVVITYIEIPTTVYIKENGTWKIYSEVYLKINDTWVKQSKDKLKNIFDISVNYVKG